MTFGPTVLGPLPAGGASTGGAVGVWGAGGGASASAPPLAVPFPLAGATSGGGGTATACLVEPKSNAAAGADRFVSPRVATTRSSSTSADAAGTVIPASRSCTRRSMTDIPCSLAI